MLCYDRYGKDSSAKNPLNPTQTPPGVSELRVMCSPNMKNWSKLRQHIVSFSKVQQAAARGRHPSRLSRHAGFTRHLF